jgi:DNA-binding transcriptional regulator YhcF (GntR family)
LLKHPRYISIAIDIAEKIVQYEFYEEQKIKGRSTLASGYNVSPETIRKSLTMLAELDVVKVLPNSGVIVKSRKNAADFLNKFSSNENLFSIREDIKQLIYKRNLLNLEIDNNIDLVLENFTQLKSIDIIKHYEYEIGKKQIEEIIKKAKEESTLWSKVIDEFNERFSVPFKLSVGNQEQVILNSQAPIVQFEFNDHNGNKNVTESDLRNVLSTGEKRALYLLNIIFEVQARKESQINTLFIIDDIADSFDYKNKYAIIEYLKDISGISGFSQIILTHNYDFLELCH